MHTLNSCKLYYARSWCQFVGAICLLQRGEEVLSFISNMCNVLIHKTVTVQYTTDCGGKLWSPELQNLYIALLFFPRVALTVHQTDHEAAKCPWSKLFKTSGTIPCTKIWAKFQKVEDWSSVYKSWWYTSVILDLRVGNPCRKSYLVSKIEVQMSRWLWEFELVFYSGLVKS